MTHFLSRSLRAISPCARSLGASLTLAALLGLALPASPSLAVPVVPLNPVAEADVPAVQGVDRAKVFAALGNWINDVNGELRAFEQRSASMAAREIMNENSEINQMLSSSSLNALEKELKPLLNRWNDTWDVKKLSAEDQAMEALLRENGMRFEGVEGCPYLYPNRAFLHRRIRLDDAGDAYRTVLNGQPELYYSDGGCRHSLKDMGRYALEWEKYIRGGAEGQYRSNAKKRWRFFMDFLMFSDHPNTSAFDKNDGNRMGSGWMESLADIAGSNTGTRTGAVLSEYLAFVRQDGRKLTSATRKRMEKALASSFEAKAAGREASAESAGKGRQVLGGVAMTPAQKKRLMGRHLLGLQWLQDGGKELGRVVVKVEDGELHIKGRQENRVGYVSIDGVITAVTDTTFTMEGKIETQVSFNAGGKTCPREGTFEFLIKGSRKYWRLQQMQNPCESLLDYVDIYF